MHTILYREPVGNVALIPFGYPGNAPDRDTFKSEHNTVFGGHVVLLGPCEPVGPCAPVEPDTNNNGFVTAAALHSASVTLVPFEPAKGILPDVAANDAVNATLAAENGTLAVVAVSE